MSQHRKQLSADMAVKGGRFTAKISTDSVDRDGEVLVPQGMDSTDFDKNPVVFWNHDYDKPVGKSVKLVRGDRYIEADTEFAERPEGYQGEWFPDFVKAMVDQGVVKGVSVGFREVPGGTRSANRGDVAKYGEGIRRVYSKWKLSEYSVAPLPANQDALITVVKKGLASPGMVKSAFPTMDMDRVREKTRLVISIPQNAGLKVKQSRPADLSKIVKIGIAKRRGRLYL